MEQNFALPFADVRHELSLISLLSLTDPNKLRQSKFTDYEIDLIKKHVSDKIHRQRILKKHVAIFLLESQLE